MKRLMLVLVLFLAAARAGAAQETMRVDYYHTGNDKEEWFSLDRILIEPLPWAGNPARPLDTTNNGKYFFEILDQDNGRAIYSRGFNSIYGEWETTAEAKLMNRTFSESLRFPAVGKPACVVVKKRDAKNVFQDIWTFIIDPADKFIARGLPALPAPAVGPLIKIHEAGDPLEKLDLLILGDGYTAAERGKFERDARRLTRILLETMPFKERQRDINVWGLSPAAAQSGISRPSQHIFRRSPDRRHLRRVRFRALHPHLREQGVSRYRFQRAVRGRRDPHQQRDVRRRRNLRPLRYCCGQQRVGAVRLRARVRPPPGGACRRVLHVGRGLLAGH